MPGRNNRKINQLERKANGQQMGTGAAFPVSENGTTYQMTIQDLLDLLGEGAGGLNTTVKKFSDAEVLVASNADVFTFLLDATNNDVKVVLPHAVLNGNKMYVFKRVDNSENQVMIQGSAIGNTIDGDNSILIHSQYESKTLVSYSESDPTGWFIV